MPATAPVNGASQPLGAAQQGTGTGTSRRENVTNYEVDRTVRVIRNSTGNIRRLNAAVVLNHRTTTDAKGKTTTEAISQEELDKLTALVREAIGADEKRGDSVKLITTPFQITKEEPEELPLWKDPETRDMLRTLAVPLGLALAALIVVFGATEPDERRFEKALYTSMAMREALAEFNRERMSYGETPLEIGVGIASGTALAGQVVAEKLQAKQLPEEEADVKKLALLKQWMDSQQAQQPQASG